jgi:hypothetical protein
MNLNAYIQSFLTTLGKLTTRKIGELKNVEICPTGYKAGNEPPQKGWAPYDICVPLTGDDAHFWLRASFRTPSVSENEYLILVYHRPFGGRYDKLVGMKSIKFTQE